MKVGFKTDDFFGKIVHRFIVQSNFINVPV